MVCTISIELELDGPAYGISNSVIVIRIVVFHLSIHNFLPSCFFISEIFLAAFKQLKK